MWKGPQSPAISPGSSWSIRLERHVYQAGSRVGALTDGSWRNVHPNASRSPAITTTRTNALLERFRLGGVDVSRTRSTRSFVRAIACVPLFDPNGDGLR